jgi:processive 1,2-diacylglycerol beta-glucosyltransferase
VKRILVLSASGGAGHLRAAEAVERAVALEDPRAVVRHLDVLTLAGSAFRDAYSRGYLALVNRAPAVWAYLYERLDRPARRHPLPLRRLLNRWNTRRLRREVRDFAADTVVCTHFLPAEVLAHERRRGRLGSRLGVVVTDVDVHRLWIHSGADRYFVAREEAAALLVAVGFDAGSVEVTGIPVDPRFATPLDRPALRRERGLPDGPVVLLLGGGFGVGPIQQMAVRLEAAKRPARIVVVAGRNERLRRSLTEAAGPRTTVLGFTTEIDEWMAVADLLVTKPGGLTTAEALARGLPMVLVNPIPGQEQRNSDALLESGAAVRVGSLEVLPWKVDAVLGDQERLAALRAAAARISMPDAAARVARWALGGAPDSRP